MRWDGVRGDKVRWVERSVEGYAVRSVERYAVRTVRLSGAGRGRAGQDRTSGQAG